MNTVSKRHLRLFLHATVHGETQVILMDIDGKYLPTAILDEDTSQPSIEEFAEQEFQDRFGISIFGGDRKEKEKIIVREEDKRDPSIIRGNVGLADETFFAIINRPEDDTVFIATRTMLRRMNGTIDSGDRVYMEDHIFHMK